MESSKELHGINGIKNYVIRLIRMGLCKRDIKSMLKNQEGSVKNVDKSIISDIVEDVCNTYPDYDLIQKVMRSKLAIDKDKEDNKIYIIDVVKQDIQTIDKTTIKEILDPKINYRDRLYTSKFTYNPLESRIFYKDGDIWNFNIYNPPFWYADFFYSHGEIKVPRVDSVPPIYDKFIKHLVDGDDRSYKYILDWIANAIQNRNYCMLTTIGAAGIGKGVLGEIMRKIFGDSNYRGNVKDEIFKSKFNSQILNKRLVYVDEIKIENSAQENKLKLLINDYVEVEQKGIDAKEVRNYASFYLSSNNLNALQISGDDRRFSIVNLTDKKLLESFSQKEIANLLDDDNVEKLSQYLYYRKVDENEMMKVFKSERTELIRVSSLSPWQEWILTDFLRGNKKRFYTIKELRDIVVEEFGMSNKVGRRAWTKLQERFPERLKVCLKTTGDDRQWGVEFYNCEKDIYG